MTISEEMKLRTLAWAITALLALCERYHIDVDDLIEVLKTQRRN